MIRGLGRLTVLSVVAQAESGFKNMCVTPNPMFFTMIPYCSCYPTRDRLLDSGFQLFDSSFPPTILVCGWGGED